MSDPTWLKGLLQHTELVDDMIEALALREDVDAGRDPVEACVALAKYLESTVDRVCEQDTRAHTISQIAAAHVEDRAYQLVPDSLQDIAEQLRNNDHLAAFAHGELDDILEQRGHNIPAELIIGAPGDAIIDHTIQAKGEVKHVTIDVGLKLPEDVRWHPITKDRVLLGEAREHVEQCVKCGDCNGIGAILDD